MGRHRHCKRCGKPRPEVAVKHDDPYCSATCCREDHDVVFVPINPVGRPPTKEKVGA